MAIIKGASRIREYKRIQESIKHRSRLRTNIPAGMATSSPPLGPMLGQRNINIAIFCREFNERTANIKPGIPLPIRCLATSDKTFDLDIHKPPATYFLKQAAGIARAAMEPGREVAGRITHRHLYEIAKIKMEDPCNALLTLKQMCDCLVGVARSCGIEIVRNLDAEEYQRFLDERRIIVDQQKAALDEIRSAKSLKDA